MCCSFREKCKNSPKTGMGCSTPLRNKVNDMNKYLKSTYCDKAINDNVNNSKNFGIP